LRKAKIQFLKLNLPAGLSFSSYRGGRSGVLNKALLKYRYLHFLTCGKHPVSMPDPDSFPSDNTYHRCPAFSLFDTIKGLKIQRTPGFFQSNAFHRMGVDHGGPHVTVTE
jgi:hypothetical protein